MKILKTQSPKTRKCRSFSHYSSPNQVLILNLKQGLRLSKGATQVRNQGATPSGNFFAPLEKCVGHSLKLLDIV